MGTIKRATRQAKGKVKETIAEVLGDGKLREEAKAEQRKSEEERESEEEEEKEPSSLNPLGNLHRLT
ncbi:CsbD family protein [Bradyrhizobium sp. WSM 1738]|uniref:CsbD family protein n=1 Tax=Bradyrhizobium hereditatis TaxID=2821405 RepID=UPI001CE385FE|nr:CsbD family protein [Bradyrhizobium hereditatis]MCA6116348.1 CsbD family protein [Bradyrhizobium hereditatis]